METSRESGMATKEMAVVLTFIKKRKSTTMTKRLPSTKLFFTLLMELSMKRLCRKMSVEMCTSAGRLFWRSARLASSFSVSSRVLVFGCFVTVMRTAGFAFSDAKPSFGLLPPIWTVAMSRSRTGTLPGNDLTTPFASSSAFAVDKTPRIMYSLLYS